jgi:hypothetical protein
MINSNSRRNNDFVLLNIERARIDSPKKCLISGKTHSNRSKNIVDLGSGRVGSQKTDPCRTMIWSEN